METEKASNDQKLWYFYKHILFEDWFRMIVLSSIAGLLLYLRYISFDGEKGFGDDFFMNALSGLFSAHLIVYLALVAYLVGFVDMVLSIEAPKNSYTQWISTKLGEITEILFSPAIDYLALLIPVVAFLFFWNDEWFKLFFSVGMLTTVWIIMRAMRFTLQDETVRERIRKEDLSSRLKGYSFPVAAWLVVLFSVYTHNNPF